MLTNLKDNGVSISVFVLESTITLYKKQKETYVHLSGRSYKYIQIKALTVFKGLYLWYTSTSW